MRLFSGLSRLLAALVLLALAGCAAPPPAGTPHQVADLAAAIRALDPSIDMAEADRAAHIAFVYSHQLAMNYQITDPPLVHNTKVNMGLRPRGLCWHWAEDMERRLRAEGFETLDLHRAIANSDNPLRIEHSTAIISSRGAGMYQGIVLDPWRKGGRLTWAQTRADTDYKWKPQAEVLATKRARNARRRAP